ncbi:hypothetical protein LY76DRAFT_248058 [Colletotrichum caudatum]|nr:hypothetical protein LY76DRAFT_248058 [Colletotrichum caudatum]
MSGMQMLSTSLAGIHAGWFATGYNLTPDPLAKFIFFLASAVPQSCIPMYEVRGPMGPCLLRSSARVDPIAANRPDRWTETATNSVGFPIGYHTASVSGTSPCRPHGLNWML